MSLANLRMLLADACDHAEWCECYCMDTRGILIQAQLAQPPDDSFCEHDGDMFNEVIALRAQLAKALAQIDLKPVAVVEVRCSRDDFMPADIQKGWCGAERSPFTETHKGILVVLPSS